MHSCGPLALRALLGVVLCLLPLWVTAGHGLRQDPPTSARLGARPQSAKSLPERPAGRPHYRHVRPGPKGLACPAREDGDDDDDGDDGKATAAGPRPSGVAQAVEPAEHGQSTGLPAAALTHAPLYLTKHSLLI
jgi:hypothetical protein